MSLDFVGLFLLLAGFVIGLGAVTVIDLHGFFGRHSPYWTEATIRTHKITKPLIWIGMVLAVLGGSVTFRDQPFEGLSTLLAGIACILILNGCFLSFYISPYLLEQERLGHAKKILPWRIQYFITASFFVSIICWWSALGLIAHWLVR